MADGRRADAGGNDGRCAAAHQGGVHHQLVRAGRARWLLPGGGRRDLPAPGPRCRGQDGRTADQRTATAACGSGRPGDGLRPADHQGSRTRPAGGDGRGHVPEGSGRADRAPGRGKPVRPQEPHLAHRPGERDDVLAVAQSQIRIHRRAEAALCVQRSAVPGRSERRAAGLSDFGAVHHRKGRRSSRLSSCSQTAAIRPTRRPFWLRQRR